MSKCIILIRNYKWAVSFPIEVMLYTKCEVTHVFYLLLAGEGLT